MSTLGLELDRLELRVRNLERKLAEMENREVARKQDRSYAFKDNSGIVWSGTRGESVKDN